jgi:carbon starvation protein CstA
MTAPPNELGWWKKTAPVPQHPPLWRDTGRLLYVVSAVALTVGTTILIKMGKLRYAWVTGLPLAWDAAVTLTASWMKNSMLSSVALMSPPPG